LAIFENSDKLSLASVKYAFKEKVVAVFVHCAICAASEKSLMQATALDA
jgi:hypothetical protein